MHDIILYYENDGKEVIHTSEVAFVPVKGMTFRIGSRRFVVIGADFSFNAGKFGWHVNLVEVES